MTFVRLRNHKLAKTTTVEEQFVNHCGTFALISSRETWHYLRFVYSHRRVCIFVMCISNFAETAVKTIVLLQISHFLPFHFLSQCVF